jgi:uncharacterized CHY-type Zn-finger protein
MRILHPPTEGQRRCRHWWKETSTKVLRGKLVRRRYYTCLRCDLHIRTLEQPDVTWWEKGTR